MRRKWLAIEITFLLCCITKGVLGQKPNLIVPSGQRYTTGYAISKDGKYFVTASYGNTVKIWDFTTRREVYTFEGHTEEANAVAISDDDRYIASGSYEGLLLWQLNNGRILKKIFEGNWINSIAFSPDGKLLAAASESNRVIVYDLERDSILMDGDLLGPGQKVAFFPDSKRIAVLDNNAKGAPAQLLVYDVYSAAFIDNQSFSYKHGDITDFEISPDGNYLFSSVDTDSANIRVHSVSKNKDVARLWGHKIHPQTITSGEKEGIIYSSTSVLLNTGIKQLEIKKWDWEKGVCLDSTIIDSITYSPDRSGFKFSAKLNQLIAPVSANGFGIIDPLSLKLIDKLSGRTQGFNGFFELPGNRFIICGEEDNAIKEINFEKGSFKILFDQKLSSGFSESFLLSDSVNLLLLPWSRIDSSIYMFNLETRQLKTIAKHEKSYNTLMALSKNEQLIAVLQNAEKKGGWIDIFNIKESKKIKSIKVYDQKDRFFYVDDIKFLPDNRRVAFNIMAQKDSLIIWDFVSDSARSFVDTTSEKKSRAGSIAIYDNDHILMYYNEGGISLLNTSNYRLEKKWAQNEIGNQSLALDKDKKRMLVGGSEGTIKLYDTENWKELKRFKNSNTWNTLIGFTSIPDIFYTCDGNLINLWNLSTGENVAKVALLDTIQWVVIKPNGLFDASPEAMKLMYFVVNDSTDTEDPWKIIELDQLKHRYYQPDLLRISLGFSRETLREPPALDSIALPPKVNFSLTENNQLQLKLKNQHGGIGKISVYMDNAELIADARPDPEKNKDQQYLDMSIDLNRFSDRFYPGITNKIKIVAWNGDNWISSKPETASFTPIKSKGIELKNDEKKSFTEKTRLFALVFGTSDYAGAQIDLKYASKDAIDFASALEMAAKNLFGTDHVEVGLFNSDQLESSKKPTKENFLNYFKSLESKIRPNDIFLIYLSGHGVNYGGSDGDFYYLTSNASGADAAYLNDPAMRTSTAISSAEMTVLLNKLTAKKKILILDACASGKAAETMLAAARDVPASQVRALDRMKDRTGFYILSGSASDAVSYESSVYGQGLLTYSLLKAMKGAALRIDGGEEYVDIQKLLQYAVDEVPELAKGIGGIQKPLYRSPDDQQGFDIGREDEKTKKEIQISEPKPVFITSTFQDQLQLFDTLGLSEKINARLRELTTKGKKAELVFTEAKDYPGAYRISGTYESKGNKLSLKYVITKDKERIKGVQEFEAEYTDPEQFITLFLEQLMDGLNK